MNWKNWLTGLFWAIATGVGGGITFVITDPEHYNFDTGWHHLLAVSAGFGVLAAGSYLKDSRPATWKDQIPTVADLKKTAGLSVLLLAATLSACASLPVAKDTAITGLQASEVALGAAQDQERALCFNNPLAESGPHCTNPLAVKAGLTDARHQSARDFFIAAFSKQKLAATALQLWQPGLTPPQDVVDYQTAITNLLNVAKLLDPSAKAFLDKAQSAVDQAATAAAALGVK